MSLEKEPGCSQTMTLVEDYCHSFSLFSKITGNFTALSQSRLDLSHEQSIYYSVFELALSDDELWISHRKSQAKC